MHLNALTQHFAAPGWLGIAALFVCAGLAIAAARRQSSTGEKLAIVLRAVALALIAVALAGPLTGHVDPHTELVFAVDTSASVAPAAQERARTLINRVLAEKPQQQRVGIVAFGSQPVQQRALHSQSQPVHELDADVDDSSSNIARAVEYAASRFRAPSNRRIVLISDGLQTHGSLQDAANAIANNGVQLIAIPLPSDTTDTFELQMLDTPDKVSLRAAFRITAHFWSRTPGTSTFQLFRDGTLLTQARHLHGAGRGAITFTDQLKDDGIFEYELVASNAADRVPENNTARAFISVRGQPKVAVLAPPGHDTSALQEALATQGLDVSMMLAAELPTDVHSLSRYALIVLANISAFDLSLARMAALESYVKDVGGGVLVAGGTRAYSAGGYQQTPLEKLLPVVMEIPAEVNIPSLIVAILLDRSGSMSGTSGGEEKLAIAKSAAFAAIEVLGPLDRVGVLAFDSELEWVVPVTQASRRLAIAGRLSTLNAGGGTNLEAALDEAASRLGALPAKLKHLIVLSDGLSDTSGDVQSVYDEIIMRLSDARITISTVAFGADADQPLMARLAAGGNGRFYHTDDPRNVPRIFTSETVVISRGLIVEKTVEPTISAATELLEVLAAERIPVLDGYMRVHPKPSADVLLATADKDPLLALWQFGLGRVAAFTTDLAPRWSRQWLEWPRLPALLAGVSRWTMRARPEFDANASYRWQDQHGTFVVDVTDARGEFANGLQLAARIAPSRGSAHSTTLEQVGPGLYQVNFESVPGLRYTFTVSEARTDGSVAPLRSFATTAPVARERSAVGTDRKLLRRVATATGGRVIELDAVSPRALLTSSESGYVADTRLGWPWISAALVVLLLDLGLRRLLVARTRDVQTEPGQ
jgi:uncharacterized membrane protein